MTTAERNAIQNPAEGLRIYNTDTHCENFYNGIQWKSLCGDCPIPVTPEPGTHVLGILDIEWHWNAVANVDGYKYNISNSYATATDLGNLTTYTQTGLNFNTSYSLYVWAYSNCGFSAAPVVLTSTTLNCPYGDTGPGGGLIFYCSPSLFLESTTSDNSGGAEWGCSGTAISGADGQAIGTGAQNTTDIVNGCGTSGIAARICNDLVSGGQSDWFLPSKDELSAIYTNLKANGFGGFADDVYWSSSENGSNDAWGQGFNDGPLYFKYKLSRVRCVRAF
ncbi:MAG: DUF1566 domain-containing protein [Crocinitomicaceae bacterium]|nr:DUF1566 domain-containing protein [Crocinitomicaceae bacterium]